MTQPTHWLRRGIAALASSVLMLSFTAVHAAAPQIKTQAPGFYRMMLGDFEVTALFDGTIDLEVKKLLTNTTQAQVGKLLDRSFKKELVPTSVNSYLINTGSKLVLIDTGAGSLFGPTLGNLRNNLLASGYKPEQVDDVFITHMHGDHVGGLIVDGKLAFPNATIHAGQEDADFWLSKANLEKASPEMKSFFQGAQASLNPYVEAGKFKPLTGGAADLVPGIKAVAAHGHTPGHNTYVVESKGQKLVLWGDLMHVASVQFVQPQVTISFDVDSKTAAAERKKAYADAAKGRYLVAGAHLPFPGLGRIRAEGSGYAWVPVDYQQVR
ncbi:glyoxylase-like metal-dependent hydrolase (beta-lactamase superfamily II) [Variovorax boronicumulans]|uniref:MBL fold metallo-hydrolase n=1 Tax=Variovorax boronicumulans TaxID=436515 RepID=UPI0027825B83|nr:MBL fold metallo-hydrolase [Variovorax boronicumulans]MDQ0074057.1 glyoxylase-like metal-dependent hydrolase (beta-lactamase superfamily II) [Variovorax boronicumulans]